MEKLILVPISGLPPSSGRQDPKAHTSLFVELCVDVMLWALLPREKRILPRTRRNRMVHECPHTNQWL